MHVERLVSAREPQSSAHQDRDKRKRDCGREESEAESAEHYADEHNLRQQEGKSLLDLLVKARGAAGVNANLHKMDLVAGKEPVSNPKGNCRLVKAPGS